MVSAGLAALAVCVAGEAAGGEVIPYGGPAPYQFVDDHPFDWVDISDTGTEVALTDDGSVLVDLPFDFKLYGVPYDQVGIAANGVLVFDPVTPDKFPPTNDSLPTAVEDGSTFIAVHWDDLFPTNLTDVVYQVDGEEPHRTFTVQWHRINRFDDLLSEDSTAAFGVVLYERTNLIVLQYESLDFGETEPTEPGASATVGVQASSQFGQTYSFDAANLMAGLAILVQTEGCGQDDVCELSCDFDPDCPVCIQDDMCNPECVMEVDPDCPVCEQDGVCNMECASDPDCTPPPPATCVADGTCDMTCETDPDCENCEANDVCNPVCPADPDCDGGCAAGSGSGRSSPPLLLLMLAAIGIALIRRPKTR